MSSITLTSLVQKLKKMDFQDAEILDLFRAIRLDWGAVHVGDFLEIRNRENSDLCVLRVRNRNGVLKGWVEGPACTIEFLTEALSVANEIKNPTVHDFVMSRVMFSDKELTWCWRYKELFQMVPCIHEIRVSSGLDWYNQVDLHGSRNDPNGPPYPFLLEVSVPKISNIWLQNQIGLKLLDKYQSLLCTLLKGVSGTLLWPNERQWIALKAEDHAGINYQLLHSGIGIERGGRYDSWTEWHKNEAQFFVPDEVGIGYDDSLLPYQSNTFLLRNDIEELMDKYFSSTAKQRIQFDRASYFYSVGQKLRSNPDLAIMNYAIAVECLLHTTKTEYCSVCGKDKQSLTKKFNEFLAKYAPVSAPLIERREELYSVRSMIAHGSRSMVADYSPFSLVRDRDTPLLMDWLVRKSIVGWLTDL